MLRAPRDPESSSSGQFISDRIVCDPDALYYTDNNVGFQERIVEAHVDTNVCDPCVSAMLGSWLTIWQRMERQVAPAPSGIARLRQQSEKVRSLVEDFPRVWNDPTPSTRA
jgi:hypothetical protein